ncbi:unnamed protein product [Vicia faba]|uniref:Uncharacterized protein n=1 Tax=Vicia faba TaxID=3906 RepID=A0AAV0ZKT8_VICFA|nr:unnamed protein product [Vicia faba]
MSDQQTYVRKRLGFKFRIEYKPGVFNRVADALSRVPAEKAEDDNLGSTALMALVSSPIFGIVQQPRKKNSSDLFLLAFKQQLAQNNLPHPYTIVGGVLLHHGRYVINPASPLCSTVIREFHDAPSGGHAGIKDTLV